MKRRLRSGKKDSLNPEKFKFVGLKDITSNPFDHFIRVQGKLDGDENSAVFAEAPGTITSKFADVGEKVVKGQILAQIDDKQYRSQMQGLQVNINLHPIYMINRKDFGIRRSEAKFNTFSQKQIRSLSRNRLHH